MEFRHKIFEGLKNTPEGWRFCNCWNKEAKFAGDQYETPYTLEEVLYQKGNGVGVLLGKHSSTVIKRKKYGLGAIDFDGTGAEISFKHYLGIDASSLPRTVSVASGKKDRKQIFFWIPDENIDRLKGCKKWIEGQAHFELRIGNEYSMVAGVHPETDGYFWINSPADTDIAIAPLLLLEGWEEVSPRKKKDRFSRRIKREKHKIKYDVSRVEKYLEKYFVPANNYSDYDTWMKVLMALHHLSLEWEECTGIPDKCLEYAHRWSYEMGNYDAQELEYKWDSFSKDLDDAGVITIGSFFRMATQHPQWEKDEVKVQEDFKKQTKRKRSELLKDLLKHAKSKDLDSYFEDFAEYEHRYKRKPSLINMDLLHELRNSYSSKTYKVGKVDMSRVVDLEYILEGFLIRGEVHQFFAGAGMGKTSLLAGMIKAGYKGVGFLDEVRHRDKFKTLWIACDGGSSRFKSVYEEFGLTPEMVDVIGGDIQQGLTNWKWTIPDIVLLIEDYLKSNEYGLVVFDSVKGMLANTGFQYTDNEHADSICQFLREIIAEPFGLAVGLINHLGVDTRSASGAKRWGEAVAMNIEIKTVMDRIGDGNEKEENHSLRKLCKWKNPIGGRAFLDYKIENGIFVPARNSKIKGDCWEQMKEVVQKVNFETGAKVFHKTDLDKLLPHYSAGQIQRIAKEHLQARNGIFKAQKDSNGKETPATYVLKPLYVLGNDENSAQN